ncbi:collectrin [Hyperolius riggenbachi]|uniref:collectrin n=1 Tax=Hyperolius riggenbachi TaxID=752182 RepID=UPI0035A2B020
MRMLGIVLFLISSLISCAYADLCTEGVPEAFKVRLSLKKALGDKAYKWNEDEEFLFRAVLAFVMRAHVNDTIQLSDILMCNVTERISFSFVVTSPSDRSQPIGKARVANAIRLERNRINSAFLVNDDSLEFIGIPAILTDKVTYNRSWLIVFGVVLGILGVAAIMFIVSAIRNKRKKNKTASAAEQEQEESDGELKYVESVENGSLYDTTINVHAGGVDNEAYDDITPL